METNSSLNKENDTEENPDLDINESDNELGAESLPHENFAEIPGIDIESRSARYTGNEVDWQQRPNRKFPGTMHPTPPAPPGTPHSPSENNSNGSGSLLQPVPYIGKATDSSIPCSSDSLDTFHSLGKPHSHVINVVPPAAPDSLNLHSPPRSQSRSATPITDGEGSSGSPVKHPSIRRPAHIKESESSSDIDTTHDHHMHGRKKKSVFKKAQQRVQHFLKHKHTQEGEKEMDFDAADGYAGRMKIRETKYKKKQKKHEKEKHMDEEKGNDEMTQVEREQWYGIIASRLVFDEDSQMSEKEEQCKSDSASAGSKLTDGQKSKFTKSTLTSQENEETRECDDMDIMMASNAGEGALHSPGLVTYNHFQNILQESIGQEQEFAQIAAIFSVTKCAMKLVGASGALALQIKEMCFKYIEDKFAEWIVGQGGWERMLSEGESESDSELD